MRWIRVRGTGFEVVTRIKESAVKAVSVSHSAIHKSEIFALSSGFSTIHLILPWMQELKVNFG
jgi:hypothetical protein